MTYAEINPITEVRRNRELLLEKYGGIDGLHRHMEEERPKLTEQGWKFVTFEELAAKKQTAQKQTVEEATACESCDLRKILKIKLKIPLRGNSASAKPLPRKRISP